MVFNTPANCAYFLRKVESLANHCDLHAHCLMPNHFNPLVYLNEGAKGCGRLNNGSDRAGMQTLVRNGLMFLHV